MISADTTQQVNRVLSSVDGKLCHWFITNPYRAVKISKKSQRKQAQYMNKKMLTENEEA